jgi:hypothetical protein
MVMSIKLLTAPGPSEINDAKDINALALLDNGRALDISQLTSLIKDSSFVVANDTGPAHIAAHVGAKGLLYLVNIQQLIKLVLKEKILKQLK